MDVFRQAPSTVRSPQAYLDLYEDADIPEPPVGDWAQTEDPDLAGFSLSQGGTGTETPLA